MDEKLYSIRKFDHLRNNLFDDSKYYTNEEILDMSSEIKFKYIDKDELRKFFEILRSRIIRKCNSCIRIITDREDHCNGWTKTKCIWRCDESARELVELANKVANEFTLTEEEIDEISKTLEDNISEDSKLMRSICENPPEPEKQGLVPEVIDLSVDPYKGKMINAKPHAEQDGEQYNMDELIFGKIRQTYTESTVKELSDMYSITNNDAYRVLNLIRNTSEDNIDGLYKKLPLSMRETVDGIIHGESDLMSDYDKAAKDLLMQFQTDIEIAERTVDLDKIIQSTYADTAKEIGQLTLTSTRDIFLKTLPEEVNKLRESDNKEDWDKAAKIVDIVAAYDESYHFTAQLKYLSNISQKNRRKIYNLSKYNTVVNAFNDRYRYSTKNIKDIRMILPILYRKLKPSYPWVTENLIKSFIILTCLACDKMSPDNIAEHTYMFYTVQIISLLDFVDERMEEEWKFARQVLDNVVNVLDILTDITKKHKNLVIYEYDRSCVRGYCLANIQAMNSGIDKNCRKYSEDVFPDDGEEIEIPAETVVRSVDDE